MSVAGGPDTIQDSLVLSLDAADRNSYPGSGATWFDLSGNGYNFIGNGNYGFSNNAILFNRDNAANTGTVFTLSNIANQLKIENFLAGSCTIEVWHVPQTLNSSNFDANEVISGVVVWPGFHNGMVFSSTSYQFTLWNSTQTNAFNMVSTSSISLPSVTSFNQMITSIDRSNTTSYIYRNGTQVYSTGSIPTLPSMTSAQSLPTNTLNIGAARNSGTFRWFYTGSIAIVRLYNRALSASEVAQNYNSTKTRFGL